MLTTSHAANRDYQILHLGDVPLQSGEVLIDARLAFKNYGTLNAARDNCIVFPTYYTGTHASNARMIGTAAAPLNADRWFIVVPNIFGNGLSSSPSNASTAQRGADFPHVTVLDNVRCQHRLVVEFLGIKRVALATGWSMGALQAYQWAVSYPDLVKNLLPFCGAARCAPHNFVFLEGVKAALCADQNFQGGCYQASPTVGLRAFGRVYAGWAYSQRFFRDERYRDLGYSTIEELLRAWEDDHAAWDGNDLLTTLWTWQHADVSANAEFEGNLARALGTIQARTIVMPCDQDLYFTLDDNRAEAALIANAELRPFVSAYGHCAGAPGRFPAEMQFLRAAIRDLLGD